MERIRIAEEDRSPYVLFDGDKAILEIGGISSMENAADFYQVVLDGIEQFKKDYTYPLAVTLDFHAFNTSSARQILAVLKAAKDIPAIVKWVYEDDDEDMLEAGEDYASMVNMEFVFEEKPSE